jgi:hypothetical protein
MPRRDALAGRFGGMEFLRRNASSFGACAPLVEVLEEFGKLELELAEKTRWILRDEPEVELPPCRDV